MTQSAFEQRRISNILHEGGFPADRFGLAFRLNGSIILSPRVLGQFRAVFAEVFHQIGLRPAGDVTNRSHPQPTKLLGSLNGLAPSVQNYALGFSVNFPIFDLASVRAREAEQSASIRAQAARAQQIAVDLRAQWNRAVAMLQGARRIAANTPVQVAAARAALAQSTARYQAGLGNVDEVAESQRLLTQSEIDDALARLAIWRGLLAVAAAAGDIQPFVAEAGRP